MSARLVSAMQILERKHGLEQPNRCQRWVRVFREIPSGREMHNIVMRNKNARSLAIRQAFRRAQHMVLEG